MPIIQGRSHIAYRLQRTERQDAETILLLHGNGFRSSNWGALAELLSADYHLLFTDLHGGNGGPIADITWDSLCGELHDIIEREGIRELSIIGHSFGGSLAVAFAERYPELIVGLVLLSIVVFYPHHEGNEVIRAYTEAIAEHGLQAVLKREVIPFLTLRRDGEEEFEAIKQSYEQVDESLYRRLFHLQMMKRPIHEQHRATCPTLLLAGERDKLYMPALQSITAGYFANSSFLIVPRAANALFVDQPQVAAQWITDFLRKRAESEERETEKATLSSHLPSLVHSVMHAAASGSTVRVPELHVDLFQAFQVRLNGERIVGGWEKRYAKNVFAYLVMHPGCSRETLCDALFPELSRLTALNNLRVYLGHLKQLLRLPDGESVLVSDRQKIRLHANVHCDLRTRLDELDRITFMPDGDEKLTAAGAFLREHGAAPFMTDLYDPWYLDCRSRAEESIIHLAEWAAARETAAGRLDSALRYWQIAERFLNPSS